MTTKYPNVVSIAGVDPSGGAGVLADIKTISALNAYACGVVTAVTAQNTKGVTGAIPISVEMIAQQIDTLFEDVRIDAVKIGMLFDAEVIKVVAQKLKQWNPPAIVLDPVMVAKSGDPLLQESAIEALKTELLPIATVITPNIPEAECLLGVKQLASTAELELACSDLWHMMGDQGYVCLKGGHRGDAKVSEDYFFDGKKVIKFAAKRYKTENTHGTGCALSSAIAALIPQTESVEEAFARAKKYISKAIKHSDDLTVGSGHGPVKHFYKQWK